MPQTKMMIPTRIGRIAAVSGAAIQVELLPAAGSGFATIEGQTYRVGQVGTFVRIPQGYQDLFGYVTEVIAKPVLEDAKPGELGRSIKVQLVGEVIGKSFERGISQYPNIDDEVHLVTESDLSSIYRSQNLSQVAVGTLSSSENIPVTVDINALVSKHSAVVGSTGAGKSTAVASILRSIVSGHGGQIQFPGARVVMIDVHGEYAAALSDVSRVYRINADTTNEEHELSIPYWALPITDLLKIIGIKVSDKQEPSILSKILDLKKARLAMENHELAGVTKANLTVDTPIPFSLKKLWYELTEFELRTYKVKGGAFEPEEEGDISSLTPPTYKPAGAGSSAPFLNQKALGIQRQLETVKSRLLDKRYEFLLRPSDWEPNEDGVADKDLAELLEGWIGHDKQVTILDLSGVPSEFLSIIIGKIISIIYEAMFWGRDLKEGAKNRPILFVLEEAHRYLSADYEGEAKQIIQRIVKEGRKYGMGAMIVSQRPVEVDDTVLSQCGTFFTLRLSNPSDRGKVKGALPDSMAGLMEMLPVLRTGEALIVGEAAKLPVRCRMRFPKKEHRPNSRDPDVSKAWQNTPENNDYSKVINRWRAKDPKFEA